MRALALTLIGVMTLSGTAWAEEPWRVSLTPYLWGAGLEGNVRTRSNLPTAEVDASFGDILDNTDFAAMLLGEVGRGRWSALADLTYLKMGAEADTPGRLFSDAKLTADTTIFSLAGAYRVLEQGQKAVADVDVVAGARMWHLDGALTLGPGLLSGVRAEREETWVDPIIGLHVRHVLNDRWRLEGYADIGGFGVSSDVTWQVYGGVGADITDRVTARFGYRHLAVDYEDGGFLWDVSLSGPILGVTIRL